MATLESRSFDAVPKSPPTALSAADFTDETMLAAEARRRRSRGWRRAVYVGQRTRDQPRARPGGPPSRELERRLRTPIEGSRRVVVMSRKGGVGKTTIALALGSTFAMLRGDRVIAVDANPDAGNLAHRVAPTARPQHHRRAARPRRDRPLRHCCAATPRRPMESRLEVLASDDDPRIGMALDRNDYHRLITLLDRFYNLILLDTGTGILDSANQGLLCEADQLVLVLRAGPRRRPRGGADPRLDGRARLRRARRARRGGGQRTAPGRRAPRPDAPALREAVRPRGHDPLGPRPREGSADRPVLAASARPATSLVEVAAAVADNFVEDRSTIHDLPLRFAVYGVLCLTLVSGSAGATTRCPRDRRAQAIST